MARLRYIGGGFLPKVPARDLSAEEVRKFGLEKLLKSGIYKDLYPPERFEPVEIEEPPELEEAEGDLIEEDE
jgi:hypothetical protein